MLIMLTTIIIIMLTMMMMMMMMMMMTVKRISIAPIFHTMWETRALEVTLKNNKMGVTSGWRII